MISCIVAVDEKWAIGKNNGLLFNIKQDMEFFKETTSHQIVACGYNTLLSFPGGRPLKNRTTLVLAPEGVERDDCLVYHSFNDILKAIQLLAKTHPVFIIGGAMFYKSMLPYIDDAYVTRIKADGEGTVFFPNLEEDPEFDCVEQTFEKEENGIRFTFNRYRRVKENN